jgi:hypothetical protein
MLEGRDRVKSHEAGFMTRSTQKQLWRNMSSTVLTSCADVVDYRGCVISRGVGDVTEIVILYFRGYK